jgi:hypothetical protein
MDKKIKLIWDFRGTQAHKIAEHHCIHLKEFATKENLDFIETNFSIVSEMHSIAFITVTEKDMKIFRDTLKPHRGELA